MSDPYIDPFEAVGYGRFTCAQIPALVVGIDAACDKALEHTVARLQEATDALAQTLARTAEHKSVTFTQAEAGDDPIGRAQDVLTRLYRYAQSRPDGDAIAASILNGERLTTVKRRRPAKLVAALDHAIAQVEAHKKLLDEHKKWLAELTAVRDALTALDAAVRKTRIERRQMTPELQAARAAWLKTYAAAKLIVEGVLKLHDRTSIMHEVFDDLAEIHRVPGVTDDAPAEPTPASPTPGTA
jgi:hypothetical protein